MIRYVQLTLLVLILSAAHLYGQQIGLRVDTKAVYTGEEFDLPVYIDSSVTGKNITSYQLSFTYSGSYLKPISISNADGISGSWGAPTVKFDTHNNTYTINVAGAGTSALSGTGVLFKIRFKAVAANSYASVNFVANSSYFNEGNPVPVFTNGRVDIRDVPVLTLSPASGVVLRGETLQFTAYSGAAPYSYSVTDTAIGSIDNSGLFTARKVGFTKVAAEDTNGIKGITSQQVEVRGFRLSMPDTSVYVKRRLQIPITTTDLAGLNVTSGDIEISHGNGTFNIIRLITAGTILENKEVAYKQIGGLTRISFAGTAPVTGSGTLLILEVEALGSTSLNFQQITFNESLKGMGRNAYFQVHPLATLNVYTNRSQAKIGDRLSYTVSGGVAPYTWTVSNTNLAEIDSTGQLLAKRGGTVKVRVSDVNGSSGESSVLTIFDSQVAIATERAPLRTTFDLPVTLDTIPAGTKVNAIEMTFSYGKPKLDLKSIVRTGTLTEGWSISESAVDNDTYKIALASATGFTRAGTLFYLKFELTEEFRLNEVVAVNIDRVLLNEGSPVALAQHGSITGVSCEPAAPTTTSAERCGPGQLTLTAAGGSAGNYRWYTAATGGEAIASATAASYTTPVLDTTTTYYVSIMVGACESARTSVTATIKAQPNEPLASDTVNYCQGAAAVALTATGSNLQWYTAETGGTALSGAPTPNTETVGHTSYYVSQVLNGCESARAKITVAISTSLPAPKVANSERCGTGSLTLTAEGGAAGNFRWYTEATGGTAIASATEASFSTPELSATTTYYVSIVSGSCESARTSVTATIKAQPNAPLVSDTVNYCQGAAAVALTATGSNLKWYATASIDTALGAAPTPGTQTEGVIAYFVSQTVDGCESSRAQITVNVAAIPQAPVTTGASHCGPGVVTLNTDGTAAAYRWYTTATGGDAIAQATSAQYVTPHLDTTTTYYVSAVNNGCEGERTAVIATIASPAAAPTVTAAAHCGPGSVSLLAEGGSAGNYRWYTSATGGVAISGETSNTFTTPILDTTTTYYVSKLTETCETSRTPVTATINPIPEKPTFEVSSNDTGAVVLTSSSASGNQWLLNGEEIEGATGQSYVVKQDGQYAVRVTVNGCSNTSEASGQVVASAKSSAELARTLLLYPNPAKEQVAVKGSFGAGSRQVEVRLYNALGQLLEIKTAEKVSDTWKVTLAVDQYPKGLYFVRVDNGSGIASKPLLVE